MRTYGQPRAAANQAVMAGSPAARRSRSVSSNTRSGDGAGAPSASNSSRQASTSPFHRRKRALSQPARPGGGTHGDSRSSAAAAYGGATAVKGNSVKRAGCQAAVCCAGDWATMKRSGRPATPQAAGAPAIGMSRR